MCRSFSSQTCEAPFQGEPRKLAFPCGYMVPVKIRSQLRHFELVKSRSVTERLAGSVAGGLLLRQMRDRKIRPGRTSQTRPSPVLAPSRWYWRLLGITARQQLRIT